ncbi:hypothetical protein ABZ916_02210 [Streptomyces sp. NPDC046853]|uniref:hypothetical protein n=1 Tax=Streptomyces sp. NPDC046853 TaxID=3154920 RepID=UPI00340BFD1F
MTHLVPLAKEVDDDKVTPGVLGFIVFAVMALAVWGLMKSMNKHMRKVDFKEPADSSAGSSNSSAGSSNPSAGASNSSGESTSSAESRKG